jgi:hypothetical protein
MADSTQNHPKQAKNLSGQEQLTLKQIKVHPELKHYFLKSTQAESEKLEERILQEGRVRDKLLLWQSAEGEYFMLDGHRRLEVLLKHPEKDFKWEYEVVGQFENLEQVRWEMLNLQTERRNLTPFMLAYFRGRTYTQMRREPYRPKGQQQARGKTKHLLAEEFKVSAATIERDAAFYKGVNHFESFVWKGSPYSEKDKILRHESIFNKKDLIVIGKLNPIDPGLLYRFKQLIGNFDDLLKMPAHEREDFIEAFCERYAYLSDEGQTEIFQNGEYFSLNSTGPVDKEQHKTEIEQLFEKVSTPPIIRRFKNWLKDQNRLVQNIMEGQSKSSIENKKRELEECIEEISFLIQLMEPALR